jgi:flagellar basal-body rod protein FlgG
MDASMWVAKTGLDAQQTRLNVISNNLANVNTTGFKRDRAMFEDLLYQNIRQAGGQTSLTTQAPTGLMQGTGTRIIATEKIHAQGNMINTQNALDIAINGEGFFQITQADGTTAYSRDGSFKLSSTGQLVTSTGQPLAPAIVIPANASSITIGEDGIVSVELFAGGGAQQLGQIQTARFINPPGLTPLGGNLYKETVASGAPQLLNPGTQAAGTLRQGMLESSNVNVVEEMVNMIETQRAYEINSKAISAADGMLRFLNTNLYSGL